MSPTYTLYAIGCLCLLAAWVNHWPSDERPREPMTTALLVIGASCFIAGILLNLGVIR